jgi:chemotaxis protein histidine kinase CheA
MAEITDKKLLESFAEEAHRRCAAITAAVSMVELGQGPVEGLADARGDAHGLKGTASVLGLDEIADLASRIEAALLDALDNGSLPPTLASEIHRFAADIETGARKALDSISG